MSKKKLLEESTVRKFMKFANIGHLAESYLDENEMYEEEEEGFEAAGEELPLPPEAGEEMPMDDEFPAEEEGAIDGAAGGSVEDAVADMVQAIAAVASDFGVEVDVEGAGEEMAPEGEGDDFGPAADEETPAPEEEGPVLESDEVVEEDAEVVEGVEMVMDEESIVQETVKRVTARLKTMKESVAAEKKKEDLVESITSRIIDALKSKK